ncbi:hypothetical protein BS78_06G227700 [Paspalum vaginatum]|nr:hypothetical protein BS78_06G227700 [Paspalum vaginatum]
MALLSGHLLRDSGTARGVPSPAARTDDDGANASGVCSRENDKLRSEEYRIGARGPAEALLIRQPARQWHRGGNGRSRLRAGVATTSPWADLLPDLCSLVLDRLDPVGVLRFPATCASWAAACNQLEDQSRPLPRRLRSGTPTLLTSRDDPQGDYTEPDVDAGAFALHDVCADESSVGDAEGLKGRTWIGGKDDWLVTTDYRCNVEFLNPVTGARLPLPSLDTVPVVKRREYVAVYTRDEDPCGRGWWCRHGILKVTLCRTPAHPKGYLAVALFSDGFLAATAAGDECWTMLDNDPTARSSDLDYMDAIVVEGKVFAVNDRGRIYSWDISSEATEPVVVQGPEIEVTYRNGRRSRFYLATTPSGSRLLLIYIFGYTDEEPEPRFLTRNTRLNPKHNRMVFDYPLNVEFDEVGMELYEIDATGSGTWRRAMDLGDDRALFLGSNYPFYIAVQQRGYEDLKPNCVYLADTPSNSDVAIFDLNKAREGDDGGYIIKRRWYTYMAEQMQMPMWFRPTTHPRIMKNT